MQTGNDGGALSAAQGPELEALLTDDLADVVGLLASVALEPPRTPARGLDPQAGSPAVRERGLDPPGPTAPALTSPAVAVITPPPSLPCADAELVCDAPSAASSGASRLLLASAPHWPLCSYSAHGSPPPPNYTTTLDPILPSENRPRGGDELADGPPPADPRLGVVEPEEEVVLDLLDELDSARARVAELEQLCDPQALVERDQLARAAAVALTDCDNLWGYEERRERSAAQKHTVEARRALEMERTTRRLQAMTQSARTGKTITLYFGDGRAPLPVTGPRWLAEQPPYGTAEAERWEHQRNGLIARTAKDVRREMEAEKEHETAEDGTWQDSDLGSNSSKEQEDQQDSSSDRDTHFNPDSSPKLPADLDADADRTAQAEFEEAVADGSYFADPDFEWEPGDEGS